MNSDFLGCVPLGYIFKVSEERTIDYRGCQIHRVRRFLNKESQSGWLQVTSNDGNTQLLEEITLAEFSASREAKKGNNNAKSEGLAANDRRIEGPPCLGSDKSAQHNP